MISADYCLEVCYRYKHEDWDEFVLPQWLDSVGNPSYVRIEGKNMGWTRASGQANIEADWQEIFRALTLNGDYRLVLEIEGKHFTVQRYSHDEPTGASFTIYPTVICGDCLYPDCICS